MERRSILKNNIHDTNSFFTTSKYMKPYTILIAAIAAIGGLVFGFDTAVIAGTLIPLKAYFGLSDARLGLVVASASIGCIPGALFSGQLADRYGRKKMMIVTSFLFVVAAVGSGVAGSLTELIVYRFIGGVAIGMASALAPVYISEIAPAPFRGRLGMMQQLAIVIGILLAFISNYLISNSGLSIITHQNEWRYMLGIAVVPSLIFFVLLLIVPESPRWLIIKDRINAAKQVFCKIYNTTEAEEETIKVAESLRSDEKAVKFREIFSHPYKRVVWIGCIFASIAHLTGINIIFYYAPLIFEKARIEGSILFQTMLTGVVNLIFTIVAFWLIDKLGRKKLLIIGSVAMALSTIIVGFLFYLEMLDSYLLLVFIFLYIGAFASTWGAVLWVYVAEIFPNQIRGHATSFAVFGNWIFASIISLTFPVLLSGLGPANTFFLYGIINFAILLFVIKYIFETKGVELEQVEKFYPK